MSIQLVIFDLDGVITNTSELHYKAWKKLADEINLDFNRQINEYLKGVPRMKSLEIILSNNNVSSKFTLDEKKLLIERKNSYYVKMLESVKPDNILDGIKEFISQLKQHKVSTAIASSSLNARLILNNLGLINEFDYIVNPREVAKSKPFPDIFLKAAYELDVLPVECIGIEDAEVGIEAINRAGMFSVGVGEERSMEKACMILRSTSELDYYSIEKSYNEWLRGVN